jgi:hypothetical protein
MAVLQKIIFISALFMGILLCTGIVSAATYSGGSGNDYFSQLYK